MVKTMKSLFTDHVCVDLRKAQRTNCWFWVGGLKRKSCRCLLVLPDITLMPENRGNGNIGVKRGIVIGEDRSRLQIC